MCDSKGKWLSFFTGGLAGYMLNNKSYKKAQKETNSTINAANQAAAKQIENNKIANSIQTTQNAIFNKSNTPKKLTPQRIPLNTSSLGATIGKQTSVGLNLGGY